MHRTNTIHSYWIFSVWLLTNTTVPHTAWPARGPACGAELRPPVLLTRPDTHYEELRQRKGVSRRSISRVFLFFVL